MIRRALTSSTLALLLIGGTTAQAAPARIDAPVDVDSEMVGGDSMIWIVGGVVVAAILLILILDDDDAPTSP